MTEEISTKTREASQVSRYCSSPRSSTEIILAHKQAASIASFREAVKPYKPCKDK